MVCSYILGHSKRIGAIKTVSRLQIPDIMELLKSAGHPEEIKALLNFKFGKCATIKPKCSLVS